VERRIDFRRAKHCDGVALEAVLVRGLSKLDKTITLDLQSRR